MSAMVDFAWGPMGARQHAQPCGLLIVVDVLSFTTAVSVAVDHGASVIPVSSREKALARSAAEPRGLALAGRRQDGGYTLSPASLVGIPAGTRLLLPSPNGAHISAEADQFDATVIAGCLRNAAAVARHARAHFDHTDICVIAAGERWPDQSLRPAIEDELGAGAVLDALGGAFTPEAELVVSAYRAARDRLPDLIRGSVSGRELRDRGFEADVDVALERDASASVPVLRNGEFVSAT